MLPRRTGCPNQHGLPIMWLAATRPRLLETNEYQRKCIVDRVRDDWCNQIIIRKGQPAKVKPNQRRGDEIGRGQGMGKTEQ